MSRQYKADVLITVCNAEYDCVLDTYKTIRDFCTAYKLSESDARKYIANCASFLNEDNTQCFYVYQGMYDPKAARSFALKQMVRVFGDSNEDIPNDRNKEWDVCKVSEDASNEDTQFANSYILSDRTITLTPNYVSISNNKHLTSKYPYKGFVIKRNGKFGTGEAQLFYRTNLLGLYSNERVAEKKAVTEKKISSYTPVVAMPIFADDEQKVFESIHQSAQFFGVHLTTIKNKIKTGKYIDKDNVFYTLKFLGE